MLNENAIKFNEIVADKEYRERVIKYFRLPIRLSVSEEKFLSDLDFIRQTNPEKYEKIIYYTESDFNKEAIEQGTNKPDFTMEHILQPIIEKFEAIPEWQEFLKKDYSDVLDGYEGITSTHHFYTKDNDGKHFISVDLEAANWQSLQSIIGFDADYQQIILNHSSNIIPPISKTFRTKITGLLGALEIMHYNKKLLKDNKEAILETIFNEVGIDLRGGEPFAFYADEFLIEVDKNTLDKFMALEIDKLEDVVYNNTGIKTHLTPFTLKWLDVNKSCVKLYKDRQYEILNISKDILLLINKLDKGIELADIDFEGIRLKKETRDDFISRLQKALESIKQDLIKIK